MKKFYDLTDWDVVRSDYGETYCVLSKYFDTGEEALEFTNNLQQDIVKAINAGDMTFHGVHNFFPYACGYLPMVNFKLPSCYAYDEDGDYDEDEDEDIGDDFEMTCCIMNCNSYHDGRAELALYFAAGPNEIAEVETEEIKTYNTFFI